MNEFRPASSYRSYGGGQDGRDLDITGGRIQGTVRSRSLHEYNYNINPYKSGRIHVKRDKNVKKRSGFSWSWNDPENKRRSRVAKYKYYSVEGKVKSSIKKGYRWFKSKCSKVMMAEILYLWSIVVMIFLRLLWRLCKIVRTGMTCKPWNQKPVGLE